jgi:beta-glucosidase
MNIVDKKSNGVRDKILQFPEGFIWGAGSSAYQIEGGLVNDWSEWEKSKKRLVNLKAKGLDPEEYISGQACGSFKHWPEDIDCLRQINAKAYRFSVEWSRLEPVEGKYDAAGFDYYRRLIKSLRENNIEPFITLWHWPLPLWLRDKGGLESGNFPDHFASFAAKVVAELGSDVKFWFTLNEPEVYSSHAFMVGDWPPQKKNPIAYYRVTKNLIKAHNAAYRAIKKIRPQAQVGLVNQNVYFEAHKDRLVNRLLKAIADRWWNYYILDRVDKDFIGLNNYHHNRIDYGFNKNENKVVSDFGWEIYPEAIYHVLKDLARYKLPIYIAESGVADEADRYRKDFIVETLIWVHRALAEGVNVRGYFYWSLTDNFEWAEGFTKKFGLFAVDRRTFFRTPRPSVRVYADICRANQVRE